MKRYEKSNLTIYSDFEIRKVREENNDVDLLIPLNLRVLNLNIDKMPKYILDRFQFTEVRNILIRFNKSSDNDYCTIHFLKNIDLQSAILNFTMNYKSHDIVIVEESYSASMHLKNKSETAST